MMAVRSPAMHPAPAPHTHGFAFSPSPAPSPRLAPRSVPSSVDHAHTRAGGQKHGTRARRKSVDFMEHVEVRDYQVEPFDYSEAGFSPSHALGARRGHDATAARAVTAPLESTSTMELLKPEAAAGPPDPAPRLLQRHSRSPRLGSPAASALALESPPPMVAAHERSPQPEQAVVPAQRPRVQRSAPQPPNSGAQGSRTQQQHAAAYSESQLRRAEWEVEQLVQEQGMRMDMHNPQTVSADVVSVEEILGMWSEHSPSGNNARASVPYVPGAQSALCQSANRNLQAAEESLHRLEQLHKHFASSIDSLLAH